MDAVATTEDPRTANALLELDGERHLVRRAQAGDHDAFVTLCDRYRQRLWRVVASVTDGSETEDLAQEAIIRAFNSIRGFRGASSFESWLCRIALNAAHDWQKSAWKRRVQVGDWINVEPVAANSSGSDLDTRLMHKSVRQAVASLKPRQRVPLWLHYFEGFSVSEIAGLENAPESTIRSRIRAGLQTLSITLADTAHGSTEVSR